MNEFQKDYLLKRQDYGVLYPYVMEETVTDIHWNGRQLWIDDLEKGRYMAPEVLSESFANRFSMLLSNLSNKAFNRDNPVMEVETEELRVCLVHPSVAYSGLSISLKKTPAVRRLKKEDMTGNGYCDAKVIEFLIQCMAAHCSIAICGCSGSGKTELLKYLTQYIPAAERTVTIEDVLEIHYQKMNPNKDCVEMRVAENFSYTQAIQICMKQLPNWLILSEIKSEEVKCFLESIRTGACGMTTMLAEDVRSIPERILAMAGEKEDSRWIENDTYRYLDIGILVKSKRDETGLLHRFIDQIGVFEREPVKPVRGGETANRMIMLVEDGKVVNYRLPKSLSRKFQIGEIVPGNDWRLS